MQPALNLGVRLLANSELSINICHLQTHRGEYDMHYLKARIFALVLILVSIGLIYYNWQHLLQEHQYSMKLAAFAPVGVIGGIYLLIFPSMGGKPTTAKEKIIALVVFGIGVVAGLINWYLMDPGFFGR
jgi:hypothetical protein